MSFESVAEVVVEGGGGASDSESIGAETGGEAGIAVGSLVAGVRASGEVSVAETTASRIAAKASREDCCRLSSPVPAPLTSSPS